MADITGILHADMTVDVSAATKVQVAVTITQSANQTITVTCNGTAHTSSFTANYGDTYTAAIAANTGYNPGTLSSTSGTLTAAITISATAATAKTYTITVTPNTTIMNAAYLAKSSDTSASAPDWTATSWSANTLTWNPTTDKVLFLKVDGKTDDYSSDSYSVSGVTFTYVDSKTNGTNSTLFRFKSTPTIAANTTATVANNYPMRTVTITQSANQTIHVYVPSKAATNKVDHTSTFKIKNGSTIEAEVVANSGYTAGTVSITEA